MRQFLHYLQPTSLKYRLFFSFLFLILIPYSLLQLRNYNQIETLYLSKISEQNQYQLQEVAGNFEDLKSLVFRTAIELEKERTVSEILNSPVLSGDTKDSNDRKKQMDQLFNEIKSKFLPDSNQVYYALSDLRGTLYTSYSPPSEPHEYDLFMAHDGIKQVLNGKSTYLWKLEEDDLYNDNSKSLGVLSLYSIISSPTGQPLGILRISIDYQSWLRSLVNGFLVQQDYLLADENHRVLAGSRTNLQDIDLNEIGQKLVPGKYYLEPDKLYLLNISHIASLNWDLVGQFPIQLYFWDIEQIKRQYFYTFSVLTFIFIIVTFFIASTITRPLNLLQKRMSEMVQKNFRSSISLGKYRGEILQLANTFNRMVADINSLIVQQKKEERQKEALRFQMLLSQMNPHFLLNTLNTIKWNALSRDDEATAEICVALGRMLETGLNGDVELIHLKNELELVEGYIYIQNFRYDHKFTVHYEYEPHLIYALVPKLSLQPLVENAIYHGFARIRYGGEIHIRIYSADNLLILEVEDNGAGPVKAAEQRLGRKRKGIGMRNIRERLQLLFKQEASLELISLDQGALARIKLPMLSSPPYNEEKNGKEGEDARVESITR